MGKIAAAAGLTPNTLYWYFGDKDELFVSVADLSWTYSSSSTSLSLASPCPRSSSGSSTN